MPILALAVAGAGAASAAFHAALLTGSFGALILAYLAELPLFMVGLWIGASGAALAGATAMVILAAAGGLIFAAAYFAVNAVPAVAMTLLAQLNRPTPDGSIEWYPPGRLVLWLVGLGTGAFFVLITAFAGESGGAEGVVRRFLVESLHQLFGADLAPEVFASAAAVLARFFPGLVVTSWMVMVLVNGLLAQSLLTRLERNLRPSPRMADIELPSWLLTAAAIAAVGATMPGQSGFIGGNLVLILTFAYALAGLGVVHALAARSRSRSALLVGTYALLFLFGWPLVIVALLGLAEPWLNLRRRSGGGPGF